MSLRKTFHLSYATGSQLQSMEEVSMHRHLSVFQKTEILFLHFLHLLPDAHQTNRYVFGGDAEDLTNLVVAEVFKPQQHDGSVKRLQTRDTPMQLVHSLRSLLLRVEEVDVHCQRQGLATTLAAIERNTGVERHAVYPSTQGFVAPPDTSAVRARR